MNETWTYEQGTDGLALQCHFLIRATDKCTIRIQSHTHNLDEAEQISKEIVRAHNSFKALRDACEAAWNDTHGLSPSSYLKAETICQLKAALSQAEEKK